MSKPAPPLSHDELLQKLSRADLIEHAQIQTKHQTVSAISERVLKLIKHQPQMHCEEILTALMRYLQTELMNVKARDLMLEENAGIRALNGTADRASESGAPNP